jgi:hypothetical protein
MAVEQNIACNIDPTVIDWGSGIPVGPRCVACFGERDEQRSGASRKPRRLAPLAATAAALALAAAVFGSSLGEPVNFFPTASDDVTSAPFVIVTPGPSVPPTAAPVLTPQPSSEPQVTLAPLPTFPPVPTFPPLPTLGPLPTWPPFPALPTLNPPHPSLIPCLHPGTHLGVDPCRWPHN